MYILCWFFFFNKNILSKMHMQYNLQIEIIDSTLALSNFNTINGWDSKWVEPIKKTKLFIRVSYISIDILQHNKCFCYSAILIKQFWKLTAKLNGKL